MILFSQIGVQLKQLAHDELKFHEYIIKLHS